MNDFEDILQSARQKIQEGKYPSALRTLRSHLDSQPNDMAACYLLGVAAFRSGQYENALAAFERVQGHRPDIPELKTNLGTTLAAVGRLEDAIDILEETLKEDPEDLQAYDNLVLAFLELGDIEQALVICQQRIKQFPEDAEGYFIRGTLHLQTDNPDKAHEDFKHTLTLDDTDPRYHYNYGFACYLTDNIREADRAFSNFYKSNRKVAARYAFENSKTLFQRAQILAKRNRRLQNARPQEGIIGTSPAMEDLFEMIERVSPRATTVLIRGESGTGKELCARAIHQLSDRDGPFIPFNVAAVPDDLLESELFGHTKGAFTGATQDRKGLFETSSGGTLFLDEIAEMSPSAQAKILRALEERKIRRIGDSEEIAIDVRLVSATHRDLFQRVQEGTFREDLYYRLKVVELRIPPLRDRQEDIALLADHFLSDLAKDSPIEGFDHIALTRLKTYTWPGNVRELRNAIEHATIMARNSLITEEDLPPEIVPENLSRPSPSTLPDDPDQQKQEIVNALQKAHWHRGEAADLMGLSRRHLYRLIKKHGIADKSE